MNAANYFPDPLRDETAAQPSGGRKFGQGRFNLIRRLGRGGMGSVWLARDERLKELVALKFLPQPIADDPAALAQLRREAINSRRLSHPNIIRIHDLHEHPGEEPFIAMEYVEGRNLNELRSENDTGTLPWKTLEPLARQLCEALTYAHSQNVIHRDLKPSNLMVNAEGQLKLADFGIAATISNALTRTTRIHFASGTIAYMSPQQANGELPCPADDIYAFGATFYELLSGLPPFYSGEILHQILNKPAQSLRERQTEQKVANRVPVSVEQTLMACLDKRPASRPASAKDLMASLESGRPAAPNRRMAIAAVIAGIALLAIVVASRSPDAGESTGVVAPSQSRPQVQAKPDTGTASVTPELLVAATTPGRFVMFTEPFDKADETGLPARWNQGNYTSRQAGNAETFNIIKEDNISFLRVQSPYNKQSTFVERRVHLPFGAQELRVKARVRVDNLRRASGGRNAGAAVWLVWDAGTSVGVLDDLADFMIVKTNATWSTSELVITNLPAGDAPSLSLRFGLNAASGTMDIDDLSVEVAGDSERVRLGVGVTIPKPAELLMENFEILDESSLPTNWMTADFERSLKGAPIFKGQSENGNRYFRMGQPADRIDYVRLDKWVILEPKRPFIEFNAQLRMNDLKAAPGKTAQFRPIKIVFADAEDQVLSYIVPLDINTLETVSSRWSRVKRRIAVPARATKFHLLFEMWQMGGTLDLDDIQILSRE